MYKSGLSYYTAACVSLLLQHAEPTSTGLLQLARSMATSMPRIGDWGPPLPVFAAVYRRLQQDADAAGRLAAFVTELNNSAQSCNTRLVAAVTEGTDVSTPPWAWEDPAVW
mmetsp:Transcript_17322/g.43499  ORF Transcript_17322/g.43499 Transcript_17322/m.43499 type:complete len:111 (+) Transcript_17322:569-901(+)